MRDIADESVTGTVKEFGNGAHVVVPAELIGEDVGVIPKEKLESPPLDPPVTEADVREVLRTSDSSDWTFTKTSDAGFQREGYFRFDADPRLQIEKEFRREGAEDYLHELEFGRVCFTAPPADAEEENPEPRVHVLKELENSLGLGTTLHSDWYEYTVSWDNNALFSTTLVSTGTDNGTLYRPYFPDYSSLTAFQQSADYDLVTFLSGVSTEGYDLYLEKLDLDWDSSGRLHVDDHGLTDAEILEKCARVE